MYYPQAVNAYAGALQFQLIPKDYCLLQQASKGCLFDAITIFPKQDHIKLLETCLNANTLLGRRFQEQEGLQKCSLAAGTLKKVAVRLHTLKPSLAPLNINTPQQLICNVQGVNGLRNRVWLFQGPQVIIPDIFFTISAMLFHISYQDTKIIFKAIHKHLFEGVKTEFLTNPPFFWNKQEGIKNFKKAECRYKNSLTM